MATQHFDAAGRPCYPWDQLKVVFRNEPCFPLLKRFLLCHLLVFPHIEIRIYKNGSKIIEVRRYGIGRDLCFARQSTQLIMERLRVLYRDYAKRGWEKRETAFYVAFCKPGCVVRDPRKRWF